MNPSKRTLLVAGMTIVGLCLPLAAQVCSQDPSGRGCRGAGQDHAGMGHSTSCGNQGFAGAIPGLTPDQRTKVDAIRDRHQAAMADKAKAAWDARAELDAASADPAVPAARIQAITAKWTAAMSAMMTERSTMQREMGEVLTPEQRKGAGTWGPMGGQGRRGHMGMGAMGGDCGPQAGMCPGR